MRGTLRTFLPVLLQDHTTGKNIIWATDTPSELGVGFADEITLEQLDKVQLVPRVQKRIADQKKRTSKKAEVTSVRASRVALARNAGRSSSEHMR